jgi:hypothetical protein
MRVAITNRWSILLIHGNFTNEGNWAALLRRYLDMSALAAFEDAAGEMS